MDDPQHSSQPAGQPNQEMLVKEKARTSRRRFVTGAAVTGGILAAGYVKPTLKSLGVSNALAADSGGGGNVLTTIEEFPTPTPTATAVATQTPTQTPVPAQYCSQGYWKQHTSVWAATTYNTSTTFASVFTVASGTGFTSSTTLLDVLNAGGGGNIAISRDAVTALLNQQAGLAVGSAVDNKTKVVAVYNASIVAGVSLFNTADNCPLS